MESKFRISDQLHLKTKMVRSITNGHILLSLGHTSKTSLLSQFSTLPGNKFLKDAYMSRMSQITINKDKFKVDETRESSYLT